MKTESRQSPLEATSLATDRTEGVLSIYLRSSRTRLPLDRSCCIRANVGTGEIEHKPSTQATLPAGSSTPLELRSRSRG